DVCSSDLTRWPSRCAIVSSSSVSVTSKRRATPSGSTRNSSRISGWASARWSLLRRGISRMSMVASVVAAAWPRTSVRAAIRPSVLLGEKERAFGSSSRRPSTARRAPSPRVRATWSPGASMSSGASAAMRVRSAASARWTGTVQPAITLWLAARSLPSRDRFVDGLERLRRFGETFPLGLELAATGLERSALDRGGFELALEVRHLGFPGGHQRTDTLELLGEGRLLRIALIQRGLDLGQHRR